MPLKQYGWWLKGVVITLPVVSQPVLDAVVGIAVRDPAIVRTLNEQHEGRTLVFTHADSQTKIPHHLIRADWPPALDGAWVSQNLNRPGAVHSLGYTYWGTLNSLGEVRVQWLHVESGVTGSELIDTLFTGAGSGIDDHNSPSLLRLASGKLLVFYSPHNGPAVCCRAQGRAGDPTAWESRVVIEGSGLPSYALPVQLSGAPGNDGGKIWVFYRDANNGYRTHYRTSEDAGRTWSARTVIFRSPNNQWRRSAIARPYVHAKSSPDGARIHFAISDGHPKEVTDASTGAPINSIYHCYFDSQTGLLHQSDGGVMAGGTFELPPANGFDTWSMTRVCDGYSEQRPYWQWDLQVTSQGRPVIASLRFVGPEAMPYIAGVPTVSRWDGARWNNSSLTDLGVGYSDPIAEPTREPYYHGGLTLDPVKPDGILYLSIRDTESSLNSIFRVVSGDGGASWKIERRLNTLRGGERQCIRPVVVRAYPGVGPEVLWMEGHYADFQKTFTFDGTAYTHNMFATAIQSYPRIQDGYAAFIKVDLVPTPTTIHMYWDNPYAPEQAEPENVFTDWLEYPRDVHWNRWDTGREMDLSGATAFSAIFSGRWSLRDFLPPRHTCFSNWTGAPVASVQLREAGTGPSDSTFLWQANGIVDTGAWRAPLQVQKWTTLAGVWEAGVSGGAFRPFRDGKPLAALAGSSSPMPADPSPTSLRLGHSPHQSVDNWWHGEIGFVGITRTPLSAAWMREFARSNPFDPAWKYAQLGAVHSWREPATINRSRDAPVIRR